MWKWIGLGLLAVLIIVPIVYVARILRPRLPKHYPYDRRRRNQPPETERRKDDKGPPWEYHE